MRAPGFWLYGAWIDTSMRYRSQALGAFWMVSGTLAFVLLLGTLYSQVLKADSEIYYAHIAAGYVLWILHPAVAAAEHAALQEKSSA